MARMPAATKRWTPPPARIAGDQLLKAREKMYQQQREGDSAVANATRLALETKAELEAQKRKNSDDAFLQAKIDKIDAMLKKLVEETKMIPHVSGGGGRRTVQKLLNKEFILDNDDLGVGGTKLPLRKNVKAWVEAKTDIRVKSISALGAVDTSVNTTAYLRLDGKEGPFKRVLAADYTDLIAADSANGIIVQSTFNATYAWLRVTDGQYYAKWFGAKEDGVTADQVAIQRAVNVCLLGDRPVPLVLTGPCWITAKINVDRSIATNDAADMFEIRGEGPYAGFTSTMTGFIIDTTLAWIGTYEPSVCNLTFKNVTWDGLNVNPLTQCVSPKFLKVRFIECRFRCIRCTESPNYLQSWYWLACSNVGCSGQFVLIDTIFYDLRIHNCDFEANPGDGWRSVSGGVYGGSICDNLWEGGGRFFRQYGGEALVVEGNYLEANSGPDFQFSGSGGTHKGTILSGNFFAQIGHAGSCVVVDNADGMVSQGNVANNASLFDTSGTTAGRSHLISTGDRISGTGTKFSHLGKFDADGAGDGTSATVAAASAVSLVTNTAKTVVSINLGVGVFDVSGMLGFLPGATTSASYYVASLSTVDNTTGPNDQRGSQSMAAYVSGGIEVNQPVPTVRMVLTVPTTIYLVAYSTFTVSTMAAFGTISACRVGGL
jgi:hypothetical protein